MSGVCGLMCDKWRRLSKLGAAVDWFGCNVFIGGQLAGWRFVVFCAILTRRTPVRSSMQSRYK